MSRSVVRWSSGALATFRRYCLVSDCSRHNHESSQDFGAYISSLSPLVESCLPILNINSFQIQISVPTVHFHFSICVKKCWCIYYTQFCWCCPKPNSPSFGVCVSTLITATLHHITSHQQHFDSYKLRPRPPPLHAATSFSLPSDTQKNPTHCLLQ